jgi:hypothetical protein
MFFTLKTSAMERGKRGHKMGHILLKDMSKKSADMGVGTVLRFEVKVTVLRSRQNHNVL